MVINGDNADIHGINDMMMSVIKASISKNNRKRGWSGDGGWQSA